MIGRCVGGEFFFNKINCLTYHCFVESQCIKSGMKKCTEYRRKLDFFFILELFVNILDTFQCNR